MICSENEEYSENAFLGKLKMIRILKIQSAKKSSLLFIAFCVIFVQNKASKDNFVN